MINKIFNEDCLEGMKRIPDKSVDMILCDLPYGTTRNKWDTIIPLEPLWEQYERVIKDNGAIVLTASQPFTSSLLLSNPKIFRYEWIWEKSKANGCTMANHRPLKKHENILVFSKSPSTVVRSGKSTSYFPQGLVEVNLTKKSKTWNSTTISGGKFKNKTYTQKFTNYPTSILTIPNEGKTFHPTQKPVALFEYLIKTYTNEGETVLDNCMGSGTTAIACLNTNRNYIGFELDKDYFDKINHRIESHLSHTKEAKQ